MVKDLNRKRVYRAERFLDTDSKRFKDIHAVQDYVNALVQKPEFRVRWSVNYIEVKDGRRRRRAGGSSSGGFITLPRWARYETVILHEVAHVLSHDRHGPEFVRTFIELAEIVWGRHKAMLFEGCLRGLDVKIAPEKKRAVFGVGGRPNPLVLEWGGKKWHTHPDRVNHLPEWSSVHPKTGICRKC